MDHQLQIPASLVHQCQLWITMHLEQLPVSQLSLLPLTTRKELLLQLPIADVCQLEDENFVEGIDMREFWQSQCTEYSYRRMEILRYAKEKWTNAECYRCLLYGKIASYVIDNSSFTHSLRDLLYFLYCVRKVDGCKDVVSWLYQTSKNACQLVFPPRYTAYIQEIESSWLYPKKDAREDVIKAVVSCFRGKLPKILELSVTRFMANFESAHFIQEVEWLHIDSFASDKGSDVLLKLFVNEAAKSGSPDFNPSTTRL